MIDEEADRAGADSAEGLSRGGDGGGAYAPDPAPVAKLVKAADF